MIKYRDFKEEQQKEINNLPIYWAFGQSQLEEVAHKLNFQSAEEMIPHVKGIGAGGFCKEEDYSTVIDTFKRQDENLSDLLHNDYDFLVDAIEYELGNHEYIITYDKWDALAPLGLVEEYNTSEVIQKATEEAIKNYKEAMKGFGY